VARRPSDTPAQSTIRGRRHADLRRKGISVYRVPMHEDGLTGLIAAGFLSEGDDADDVKVGRAIGAFIASSFELREPSDARFERVRLNPRRAM
jgi:hypothetical protein